MRKIMVSTSILSADFGDLRQEVRRATRCGADRIHLDVMDGHFVGNISFGPAVVSSIRGATKTPFETHMMVEKPLEYISAFADAGSDIIIVHAEASGNISNALSLIHKKGALSGIAISPQTPIKVVSKYLGVIDTLLVMSVNPGFGGQKFIGSALAKISQAKELIDRIGSRATIAVDGGVDLEWGAKAALAGAEEVVAGTYAFKSRNMAKSISALKHALDASPGSKGYTK